MSRVMRKNMLFAYTKTKAPSSCVVLAQRYKGADELSGSSTAEQRLFFRFIGSTIPLYPKSINFNPLATFCRTLCLPPARVNRHIVFPLASVCLSVHHKIVSAL